MTFYELFTSIIKFFNIYDVKITTLHLTIHMQGYIKVGHVDIKDLWIDVPVSSSLLPEELIIKSGMMPRDGSVVYCYNEYGNHVFQQSITSGDTILIGTKPPKKKKITKNPKIRKLNINSIIKFHNDKRCWSKGIIHTNCTLWLPGDYENSNILTFELFRFPLNNDKIHSKGYRLHESTEVPYKNGDLVVVKSTGRDKLKLYDPVTNSLSIVVHIKDNSFISTKKITKEKGKRFLWTIKIDSFNSKDRSVYASVERHYTWK